MSTYFCGDLIKGKYQFEFGGNTCEKSGFMMPYSGRIKRITVRILGGLYDGFFGEIDEVDGGESRIFIGPGDPPVSLLDERIKNGLFLTGNLFSIILFKDSMNLNID